MVLEPSLLEAEPSSEDELWVEADSLVCVEACVVDAADFETDRGVSAGAFSVVVESSRSRSSAADVAVLLAADVAVLSTADVVTLPVPLVLEALVSVFAVDAWAAASESNATRPTLAAISERLRRASLRSDASRRAALGFAGMR